MPSITKAALDELTERVEHAEARSENERQQRIAATAKINRFGDILDKLICAANGQPLVENDRHGYGSMMSGGYGYPAPDQSRLTDAERQAIEQERLRERLNSAESRLAAVVAVAQFAKSHKA